MPEVDMGEFGTIDAARNAILKQHKKIASYDTPWWGDKDTESGNLCNRGYVIGFCDLKTHAQWRLDYDETKKLHINWTQTVHGSTLKECYRISSLTPQQTMFDYYTGWTRPRLDDLPEDIQERLGSKKWNGRCWVD